MQAERAQHVRTHVDHGGGVQAGDEGFHAGRQRNARAEQQRDAVGQVEQHKTMPEGVVDQAQWEITTTLLTRQRLELGL